MKRDELDYIVNGYGYGAPLWMVALFTLVPIAIAFVGMWMFG